jgi:hypothetical protein
LVVEQSLLMYREVEAAGATAPHGQGMACLEDATLAAGQRHMQWVMEQAFRSQAEAQKGGRVVRTAAAWRGSSEPRTKR